MVATPSTAFRARAGRFIHTASRWADREWRWLVLVAWLIISAVYLYRYQSGMTYMALADTDDNMRYLQVKDWLAGQSWWDLVQHRMDPPRGANIHWSRLVDLPIAGLMLFFRLFTSEARADQLALGIAPLLPLLPLMLSLAFLARRLAEKGHGWFIAMLLPLGAEMGLSMFMPMRVDHHGWQLALTSITLAGLVDRKWVRGGIVAGVSSAASVAIGMEMMIYLAGAGALVALRWIFKEGAARRLQPYALSLAGTTAIGYAAFASNANRLPMCDALSPVWTSILILASAILLTISLVPLRSWPARLGAAALGGLVIAVFAYASWPQCLTGAYQLSPELEQKWLVYIREAKPIYVQKVDVWVKVMALPLTGLICGFIGCWVARRDRERLWAWATVTLMIAFAIALTFWQIRAGPAAQLLSIAPVAWAGWALLALLVQGPGWRRGAALAGLVPVTAAACIYPLYPLLAAPFAKPSAPATAKAGNADAGGGGGARNEARAPVAGSGRTGSTAPKSGRAQPKRPVPKSLTSKPLASAKNAGSRCRAQPALAALNELPPATIFTMVDLGPRLIAMSHHSAIAGPYHRNGKAILDIHHAMDGSPETFRAIAAAHGAPYLLICPGFPEGTIYQQRSPKGFYARLMRGERFPFLTPVKLSFPAPLPFTLYRIAPLSAPGRKEGAQ